MGWRCRTAGFARSPGARAPPARIERLEGGKIEVGEILIEEGLGLLVRGHVGDGAPGHDA
tara:strand:- start:3751 stop:3930 length:180 start_codon:yes stop_codon:yes gene_type:complete